MCHDKFYIKLLRKASLTKKKRNHFVEVRWGWWKINLENSKL